MLTIVDNIVDHYIDHIVVNSLKENYELYFGQFKMDLVRSGKWVVSPTRNTEATAG